ncbi:MAG: hypothetical protein R3A51_20835 [Nannocystaceae bacterium]
MDAHLGNLDSVERALIQVGASVVISGDPNQVATSRMVVFPGQGAFSDHTDALVDGAMGAALRMVIERGDPFLGICMGMQLLFESSDEHGGHPGLKVLKGKCARFPEDTWIHETVAPPPEDAEGEPAQAAPELVRRLKIPHVGWNQVEPTGEHYYFAHSYYARAENPEDVMWTCQYGPVEFPAAVRRGNVFGCQFHPEKSQWAGLRFLRSFVLGGRS